MAKKLLSLRELFRRIPGDGTIRHELRRFNMGMTGADSPPSALALAKALGFDVVEVKMGRSERGRLVRDTFAAAGFRIEVNRDDDVRTRRWTVLHEIMHAYLHYRDDPFAADQYRASQGAHFYLNEEIREEREANEAVEAVVFGDAALSGALGMFGGDEEALAKHFGVSMPTLRIALKKL